MNTESPSRSRALSLHSKRAGGSFLVALLLVSVDAALAQGGPPALAIAGDTSRRSTFNVVIERLDGVTVGIALVALLIIALLVWRIWVTVRREQPVASSRRAARPRRLVQGSADDEPFERTTMSRSTDWGSDENKRSSVGRERAAGSGRNADLPAIDQQATQWPPIDMRSATGQGVLLPDALGRSPVAPPSPYRTGGFNPYYHVGRAENRIEVEEIADTLTQAELLVQLGDPKEAMSLLARHIRETEKPGPAVWLMLLGLYQSTGREAQYNALTNGFRTLFNADVPPWATSPDVAARDLESYPQVMSRLRDTWPRGECRALLEALLTDDRGGSRQGFSLAAYRELLFLVEILEALELQTKETNERTDIERKLTIDR